MNNEEAKKKICDYLHRWGLGRSEEDAVMSVIDQLPGAPEWVSVDAERPKFWPVLVYAPRHQSIWLAEDFGTEKWQGETMITAFPASNGCGCCGETVRITHWSYLPPAPGKEGE